MEKGKEIGKEEGLKEGKEKGREENKELTAKKLITFGMDDEFIVKVTELDLDKIQKLRNSE